MGVTRRHGIVTGGTWCVDRNKMIDAWPGEDGIAEIQSEEQLGGGSACNLAVDIKRLDPNIPVETIGLVGNDQDGRFLLALADAHGIDRRQMAVTGDAATSYTDAFCSRRSGRRTHIFAAGTSALLTPEHFDFAATSGRIFHLGLPGVHRQMDRPWGSEPNGWVAVLKLARAAGLETNLELASIDAGRLAALVRPCLPFLDSLVVNDVEIGAIAGGATQRGGITDIAACVGAAKAALAIGTMRVAVVHFPMGAIAVERGGRVTAKPSLRVPESEIVGANGAGDAFAAGYLYAVHEGWSVPEALSLAHAVAGASLRSMSTTGAVEPWRKCLELARTWGIRDALPVETLG